MSQPASGPLKLHQYLTPSCLGIFPMPQCSYASVSPHYSCLLGIPLTTSCPLPTAPCSSQLTGPPTSMSPRSSPVLPHGTSVYTHAALVSPPAALILYPHLSQCVPTHCLALCRLSQCHQGCLNATPTPSPTTASMFHSSD